MRRLKDLISRHSLVILVFLIIIGGFLRFYNLNWGAPFYFHPDERNVASSISQLSTESLNPNFFAYGSLPIYAIFFAGLFFNFLTKCAFSFSECSVSFEQAVIISRIFSATLGTVLIVIVYLLGVKLSGKFTGLLASFFVVFSVGLIQFSHFGTFEMWTAVFSTLQLLAAVDYFKTGSKKSFYLMAVLTGALTAIKISNLALIVVALFSIVLRLSNSKQGKFKKVVKISGLFFLFQVYCLTVYLITNPFVILDMRSFIGSMKYESSVAIGVMSVFYTGEFFNTVPVLFQFVKVFPFLLNPFMLPFAFISLFVVAYLSLSQKKAEWIFLVTSFCVLFLSQTFLFVKWTRYMLPTLPFLYLSLAISFKYLLSKNRLSKIRPFLVFCLAFLMLSGVVFSLSYLKTVFMSDDSRILSRDFALDAIPPDSLILSEVYDLGITPFNDHYRKIILFNFYDLDSDPSSVSVLNERINESEFLILPSQRILATRLKNADKFPNGSKFYNSLFTATDKFTLIYETPCDLFCEITYLGDPITRFEGTANVFDRPNVSIFKIHEK